MCFQNIFSIYPIKFSDRIYFPKSPTPPPAPIQDKSMFLYAYFEDKGCPSVLTLKMYKHKLKHHTETTITNVTLNMKRKLLFIFGECP